MDLRYIERSLRLRESNIDCPKCTVPVKMNVVRVISPIVIIDLDGMISPNLRMNQIQNSLDIQGEQYTLRGLVETLGYHFVAHALHTDGQWYPYDDLHPRSNKITQESYKPHPVLLMYCE